MKFYGKYPFISFFSLRHDLTFHCSICSVQCSVKNNALYYINNKNCLYILYIFVIIWNIENNIAEYYG